METTEYFTVSIINKILFKKFAKVYGTQSGSDLNKEEVAGTHIKFLDDGGITLEKAEEVFVCKILGKDYIIDEDKPYPVKKNLMKMEHIQFSLEKLLDIVLENGFRLINSGLLII